MKERLTVISSAIVIFLLGCLFGGYSLWSTLKINSLEVRLTNFQKNVEEFAKQVNDEFKKRPVVSSGDPSKR